MILWLFDTSRNELVYNDPQAGPVRFSMQAVGAFESESLAINADLADDADDDTTRRLPAISPTELARNLRQVLPRADKSTLIVPGMRIR